MTDLPAQLWVLLIGGICTGGGAWATYLSISSMSWSETMGYVIEREFRHGPKSSLSVNAYITYTFEVGGYNYVSTNYKPGVAGKTIFWLPFLRKDYFSESAYEKGAKVKVYYDPSKPRRCALVVGDFVGPVLFLIIGVLMLGYAANSYLNIVEY